MPTTTPIYGRLDRRPNSRRVLVAGYIFAATLALTSISCSDRKPMQPGGDETPVLVGTNANAPADPVHVSSAVIKGDLLLLEVQYGGGCNEHIFTLHSSGVWLESNPVQTHVGLSHDAQGDMCRSLIRKSLRFDLTPLKRSWQRSYQSVAGSMMIHLAVPGVPRESRLRLRYEFRS